MNFSANGEGANFQNSVKVFSVPVIVASLGYFVDIYDLILFSIVRVPSLKELGLDGKDLLNEGVFLLNMQMGGMLTGGLIWGVMGDKRGRLTVLFGSIFLYSLANLANGFVHSLEGYAAWRFIAGVGLAGELGAGVTLVLETLPKETRGYGTMVIASVGVAGAVLANFVAKNFDWRAAFFIGAGLGMALLVLRVSVYESGMFRAMEASGARRGDFFSLFTSKDRFWRYMNSILIGLPLWFAVGVLITFAPEFAKAMNIAGDVSAGNAVMYCYIGLIFGDFASGFLSQYIGSRKKVVLAFQLLAMVIIGYYLSMNGQSASHFYTVCVVLGFAIGYWAVFITVAAEQFGSNLRATVASTVPNFIRGTVIPITFSFKLLKDIVGITGAAAIVGCVCVALSLAALWRLEETYHKDLNFIEID
ncbi:MAG: MFS transporter [Nitrospinae bacterium]|nr:MFS transporter [Nitrospinota bacterium]